MSLLNIEVVQNDLKPDIYFMITNKSDDTVVDVSASSIVVTAKFRAKGASTSLFEATCTKVKPVLGIVSMVWPADSLDVDAGRYEIEITVTDGTDPQTVLDIVQVRVKEEFGDVS